MKKIFTLLAAALMAVTASAADNLWEVTTTDAITAGTALIDNDVLTVKNVFATKGVTLNTFVPEVTIRDHTFTYSIKVISGTAPDADNPDGTEYEYSPDQTTLVAEVKKKTTVTVYYAKQSQGNFQVYNKKDFSAVLAPSAEFEKAGDFWGNNPTWGTVEYDLEPGSYVFFSRFTAINLFGLSWTGESGDTADDNVIYSWSSTGEDGVTQVGGTISYENGEGDRLNYKNGDYYTICLNGKKAKMGESPASNDAGYMKLVLDTPLQAGDKIELYGYINKDNKDSKANAYIVFKNAAGENAAEISESDSYPNINAVVGDEPGTHTIEVPAAADGCKEIWMTRNASNTNVFIISMKIIGGGDDNKSGLDSVIAEDENAPVEYYNLQGVRIAEPAAGQIVIRRQGSKVQKLLVR